MIHIQVEDHNKEEVKNLLYSIQGLLLHLEATTSEDHAPQILTINDFINQINEQSLVTNKVTPTHCVITLDTNIDPSTWDYDGTLEECIKYKEDNGDQPNQMIVPILQAGDYEYYNSDAQLEDIDNHMSDIELEEQESIGINGLRISWITNPDIEHILRINEEYGNDLGD